MTPERTPMQIAREYVVEQLQKYISELLVRKIIEASDDENTKRTIKNLDLLATFMNGKVPIEDIPKTAGISTEAYERITQFIEVINLLSK